MKFRNAPIPDEHPRNDDDAEVIDVGPGSLGVEQPQTAPESLDRLDRCPRCGWPLPDFGLAPGVGEA